MATPEPEAVPEAEDATSEGEPAVKSKLATTKAMAQVKAEAKGKAKPQTGPSHRPGLRMRGLKPRRRLSTPRKQMKRRMDRSRSAVAQLESPKRPKPSPRPSLSRLQMGPRMKTRAE